MSSTSPCPECGVPARFAPKRVEQEGRLKILIECEHCSYSKVIREGPKDLVELEIDVEQLRVKHKTTGLLGDVLATREQRLEQLRQHYANPR